MKVKELKCYFMIFNLLLSMIALSALVSGQCTGPNCRIGEGPNVDLGEPSDTPPGIGKLPSTTPGPAKPVSPTKRDDGYLQLNPRRTIGKEGPVSPGTGGNTPGQTPNTPGTPGSPGGGGVPYEGYDPNKGIFGNFLSNQLVMSAVQWGGIGAGVFGTIGAIAGGDDGGQWGAIAGAAGGVVTALALNAGFTQTDALVFGLITAGIIFILTYSKESTEVTEFFCTPWQAPIGGADCELCNEFEECSEYTCRSLGQACQIVNEGTEEQRCVWQNPGDVNSPIIEFLEVSRDHEFAPDNSIRPPATGVIIKPTESECIRAFFPLEFKFKTDEPAQCKIDYNLTTTFEDMNYYVNGNSLFMYNHTEELSLPGPDALKRENPELKNDGEYTLFVRCQDANGNFNQDAYSVNFCVEAGPDTTPPIIAEVNIPSGNPVKFNQSDFDLEVYVNEPSECKWSRTDQSYDNMEQQMDCDTRVFQMNNKNLYTCKTTLTGIQDRVDNEYFFRCKDNPGAEEGDRNVNSQSYRYNLIGTQPLNILEVSPNETIRGASDVLAVNLEVKTDNGHENGNALCYYYNDNFNGPPSDESEYVLFHETRSSVHTQRQDLVEGDYTYYIKCVDLGGNAAYTSINFDVETDRGGPEVIRVYRETDLRIITNEPAECTYSNTDCNFEIESGIAMTSLDNYIHSSEWVLNKNYYVRCKDEYNNQPFPNSCSIIVRPSQLTQSSSSSSGFLDFGF